MRCGVGIFGGGWVLLLRAFPGGKLVFSVAILEGVVGLVKAGAGAEARRGLGDGRETSGDDDADDGDSEVPNRRLDHHQHTQSLEERAYLLSKAFRIEMHTVCLWTCVRRP